MMAVHQWRERVGMSFMGLVSLTAIVSVVVLVSLPRLRGFARHENVADARDTARLLARELGALGVADDAEPPAIRELSERAAVAKALSDTDFLADGRLLRRHGYLFAVVRVRAPTPPPVEPGAVFAAETGPVLAIRAWPWKVGRTGSAALLATTRGAVFRHPNADALWNGPIEPFAPLDTWDGWRRLP